MPQYTLPPDSRSAGTAPDPGGFWFGLGGEFPWLEGMMAPQGPGFSGGQYDYGYSPYQTQPFAPFNWQNLWGPMAQQMEQQSQSQMGRLREEYGHGGARYGTPLMLAEQAGLAQTAEDMNRMMSGLQYQETVAADERSRQAIMDMFSIGQAQRGQAGQDLGLAYQDWLRRSGWSLDQALKFLGPGHEPTYLAQPGGGSDDLATWGPILASVIGAIAGASDANTKSDFEEVDHQETLEKIDGMDVRRWSYDWDPDTRHMGAMAQDFHESFGLGGSDKAIVHIDNVGVAMSGIKGLIQEVRDLKAELKELKESKDADRIRT